MTTWQEISESVRNATQAAAGWDFTLVLNDKGQVFGCGSNAFCQLGFDKNIKFISKLTHLPINGIVKKVAAGMRHSLFLLSDGSITVCGSNRKGQLCCDDLSLATPKTLRLEKPVAGIKAGQNFSLIEYRDGSFQAFGEDKHGQVSQLNQYEDFVNVQQVDVGWTHIVLLHRDGQCTGLGRNDYGQCSVSSEIKFQDISVGYEHCLGISTDQKLYSWGWNEHGNCGLGHTDNVLVPTLVGLDGHVIKCFAGSGHSFAITRGL